MKCYPGQLRSADFICFVVTQLERYFYPDITYFLSPFYIHCGFPSVFSLKKQNQNTTQHNCAAQGTVSDELSFSIFPAIIVCVLLLLF